MSTRSNIGIKNRDGSVDVVYCHWDGYLSYNGQILLDSWKLEEDIKSLIASGNMSGLGENLDSCKFYDGEDESFTSYNSLEEYYDAVKDDIFIEYAYIYDTDSQTWFVAFYDGDGDNYYFTKFQELTQELIDRREG